MSNFFAKNSLDLRLTLKTSGRKDKFASLGRKRRALFNRVKPEAILNWAGRYNPRYYHQILKNLIIPPAPPD
jgi:hypothetical protein